MNHRFDLAKSLLSIKAVQISPDEYFTWTSGLKSPIYCDNRLTMGYPKLRTQITHAFINEMKELTFQPDVIAGCATAGIPHAAWLSADMNLPMVYVRSQAKSHGKGNQIEGPVADGKSVVVIEDLISTGTSSIQAAKALQEAGMTVLGVLAIFSYGLEEAKENFAKTGLFYKELTNFDTLLTLLETDGKLTEEQKASILAWRGRR